MADALTHLELANDGKQLLVQQTLHGYSEGHRLLESSLKLPDGAARLMLQMSDLSGSNIVPGFDEYLTGYPIAAIGMFALARTWYATEMPRPGCVWTHTLLLSAAELTPPSLYPLVRLFQRPRDRTISEAYSKPMLTGFNDESDDLQAGDRVYAEVLARLYESYYGEKNAPILIPAIGAHDFERIILTLWSQQWPSLRGSMTFCTGSLAARYLGKRPFDIQCVPISSIRDVALEIGASGTGSPSVLMQSREVLPKWTTFAADDAVAGSTGELRIFLTKVGDGTLERQDFPNLVSIFKSLRDQTPIDVIIALVSRAFPQPDQALRLKISLFGSPTDRAYYLDQNESAILAALGSTDCHESYNPIALALNARGQAIAKDYPAARELIDRLFRSFLTPLGAEILAGLISVLDARIAKEITSGKQQYISTLFTAKPALAASSDLWTAATGSARDLFEAVIRQENLSPDIVDGIISALLTSGHDLFLRPSFEKWGIPAIHATLRWVKANDGSMSEDCRSSLAKYADVIMDWAEREGEHAIGMRLALVRILAPSANQVAKRSTGFFQSLDWKFLEGNDSDQLLVHAFLLALGLCNAPPFPVKLISGSFDRIYKAAWENQLRFDIWEILDPILPHLSWPNDWDKCERLVRGLLRAFISFGWPPADLRACTLDSTIFNRVLRSARKFEGSDKLFRAMQ